jgi:Xaa-Pro aminopeptidase
VEPAPKLYGQTVAEMLQFETLTWVPIDRRLVDADLLTAAERNWLNDYHRRVHDMLLPHLDAATGQWLAAACSVM